MPLPYWSVTQAAVWIATRDQSAVEALASTATLTAVEEAIANSPLHGMGNPLPLLSICDALKEVETKCALGEIVMFGRRTSLSSAEPIERHHWAHLAIVSNEKFGGVIATYPNGGTRLAGLMVTSWGWLRLTASDVLSVWPSTTTGKLGGGQNQRPLDKSVFLRRANPGASQRIDDSHLINEIHGAKAEGTAKSLRRAILARVNDIEGASDEAKVRRLTRKYKMRFGDP
jgi:hypothetical protein